MGRSRGHGGGLMDERSMEPTGWASASPASRRLQRTGGLWQRQGRSCEVGSVGTSGEGSTRSGWEQGRGKGKWLPLGYTVKL